MEKTPIVSYPARGQATRDLRYAVKPAEHTPLSCLRFVELVHQAGLPVEWCQVCVCSRQIAQDLVTDSRVAFFSFIGSARVGWELRRLLAPGTRCALEHGEGVRL